MRMTNAGDYAVRCVAYLTTLPKGKVAPRREVAQEMDIPEHFLGKIVLQLAQANIVEIIQGRNGGLKLARDSAEISLLDVVEAVVGPVSLNDCVLRPESCRRQPSCVFHVVWRHANEQLRETLKRANFESLMSGEHCLDGFDTSLDAAHTFQPRQGE